MSDFEVSPAALRVLGGRLETLSGTVVHARTNLDRFEVPGAGKLISMVSDQFTSLRADLEGPYSAGGLAEQLLSGAGEAVTGLADDYERVDEDQRAAFDALLPEAATSLTPRDDPAGVDLGDYEDSYGGTPESDFEAFDRWIAIRDGVRDILNFAWMDDILTFLGFPSIIQTIYHDFEGEWDKLGIALGALDNIIDYWRDVDLDLNGFANHIQDFWAGHAADTTGQWFLSCGDSFREHASALSQYQSRVRAESFFLYECWHTVSSNVGGIASSLIELGEKITNPSEWVSWDTGGKIGRLLFRIFAKIGRILAVLDLVMTAVHGLCAGIAQLARIHNTDFPVIPAYSAPDVNGPN